ncbi:MAG: hypothetical protein ACRDGN_09905, partial [bacterium]
WKTVSTVDLHTYEGFFTFTLGPLRPGSFALQRGANAGPTWWEILARWVMFAGASVIAGGLALHRFLLPGSLPVQQVEDAWLTALHRRWRLAVWTGTVVFLTGALGEFGVQAARIARAVGDSMPATLLQLLSGSVTRTPLIVKVAPAVCCFRCCGGARTPHSRSYQAGLWFRCRR